MQLATKTPTPVVTATARYTMREARSATSDEWDSWLEVSPGGGHVYQSHEWGEFKRTLGWKPVRLVLERDGQPAGVGQFLLLKTPLVPGSLMYCSKGPWIPWDDEDAIRTFFRGVVTVAQRERAHTVKIEPEVLAQNAKVKDLLAEIGFRKARYDLQFKTTMTVDLSPSEDEILGRMKSKTRYNIRLGAKKGVEIVEDNSPEAREAFYEMLVETSRRDNFFLRSRDYLTSSWRAMRDAGRLHLFFATHEGERLAGVLIFTFGHKYWYSQGASTNEKRNLMPTYVIQWEVMRWAKRHGITYYDMVAIPNPDNLNEGDSLYGIYRFKAGFGGEIREFIGCLDLPVNKLWAEAWYRFEPLYYRAYQKIKNDLYY